MPISGASSFADNFRISATQFPPAFTGSQKTKGSFDPAYPPDDPTCAVCPNFFGTFAAHMGDYDTAVTDDSYIYYAWGDNRNVARGTAVARPQADIRFVKLSW